MKSGKGKKFCSVKCRKRYNFVKKHGKYIFNCEICNIVFEPRAINITHRTCGPKCNATLGSITLKNQSNEMIKKDRTCNYCGTTDIIIDSLGRCNPYCSDCKSKINSKINTGRVLDKETKQKISKKVRSEECQRQRRQTNLERYGNEEPNNTTEIKEKKSNTNLKRYGFPNTFQVPELKKKSEQSMLERHGSRHNWSGEARKNGCEKTMIKRYGFPNPFQVPQFQEKINETRKRNQKDNKLVYKNIVMRSSWEIKYAQYLDENNIKWEYESKIFRLDKLNKSYIPDFYLPKTNEYIEIKGYMRPEAQEKINQFKNQYNEVKLTILFEQDLKQLGVL